MNRRMQVVGYLIGISLVLPLVMLTGGCASGESVSQVNIDLSKITKVAVVEVSGDIEGERAKNQIADLVDMEFLKRGFKTIERGQIRSLLKEQEFQNLDVTRTEDVVKAGKILNVSAVIVVNVDSGNEMSMTLKLLDVEDGSKLWIGSGSGAAGSNVFTRLGFTVSSGSRAAGGGDGSGSNVGGGGAGGDSGGEAGKAMTPQQFDLAKKVITEICKSMPSKVPMSAKN